MDKSHKKKTYISGKITGLEKTVYEAYFWRAYIYLIRKGETPISPIYLKPFLNKKIWICYLIADIRALLKCDKILMLHNWKGSRGANIERFIAKIFKIKIEYYKDA